MKRFLILILLLTCLSFASYAELVDNSLARAFADIFPELRDGYIDLNHNDSLDRLDDMDELVADSRVKDGIIQVQEIMDFLSENYAFLMMKELEAIQEALENADGTIPELIGLNYSRAIWELIKKKEELGIDGLYLSPSAHREAMGKMAGLVVTMVNAYKNEGDEDERDFNRARDELFSMIEQGYPIIQDLPEEDENILISALIQTALKEQDENEVRTKYAIKTLGKLSDPFAVSYIIRLMEKPAYTLECIKALGEIGNNEAEDVLMELLEDAEKEEIRVALFKALGRIGGEESLGALTSLIEEVGMEGGPSEGEETAIIQALSRLAQNGNRDRKINKILTEYLDDKDGELRVLAAKGLAAYPSSTNLNLLLSSLRNEKEEAVKIELVKALNISGNSQIINVYTTMYRDPSSSDALKKTLTEEIGKNPEGVRAVSLIQEGLASPNDDIREATAEAFTSLYQHNRKSVVGTLSRSVMTSEDELLLSEASAVLAELADPDTSVALSNLLKSPYPEVKKNATWALYRMGNTGNTRMLEDLKRLITSETEAIEVRINAVRSLGSLGVVNEDILQTLQTTVKMRGEKYAMLRYFSIKTLGELGEADDETVNVLARIASREKNILLKKASLDSIRKIGRESEDLANILESFFKRDDDPELRLMVLEALSDIGSEKAAELAESIDFPALTPEQKQRLVYALNRTGTAKSYNIIINYSTDPDINDLAMLLLEDTSPRLLKPIVEKRMRTESDAELISVLEELDAGFVAAF